MPDSLFLELTEGLATILPDLIVRPTHLPPHSAGGEESSVAQQAVSDICDEWRGQKNLPLVINGGSLTWPSA